MQDCRVRVADHRFEHEGDLLAEGDHVIRYPSALLKENQPVVAAGKSNTSMADRR